MVVIVYTDEQTYYAGTTNELTKLLSESRNVASSINVQAEDYNNDGLSEEISVNIGLSGVNPEDVKSVVVVQTLNYGINVSSFHFHSLDNWVSIMTYLLRVYRRKCKQK